MTEQQLELLKRYNAALKLYKERQWKAAIDAFKKALEIRPQ